MAVPFPSALIRYERLKRNWSQEGLCDGICAVSYLSKIEQGKAEPSEEILQALMKRLELEWHGGEEAREARQLLDELLEAEVSLDWAEHQRLTAQLERRRAICFHGPHMLDVLLQEQLHWNKVDCVLTELSAFVDCFTPRQYALWLMIQQRYEEAVPLYPISYVYLCSGGNAYRKGRYAKATEQLLQAYSMAAEEGRARVMLYARMLLGNCYSDQNDYETMERHYQAARRLAKTLGDTELLESIRYNMAATQMQLGMYEEAGRYFASLETPYGMALHKLAICQEKLGRTQEALQTLERVDETKRLSPDGGDYPDWTWIKRMCSLVRYRLEHPNYLQDRVYGDMLLGLYRDLLNEFPRGYALFHQPWVEEWYVASRQYKLAYELIK